MRTENTLPGKKRMRVFVPSVTPASIPMAKQSTALENVTSSPGWEGSGSRNERTYYGLLFHYGAGTPDAI